MHEILLTAHSLLRWLVIGGAIGAIGFGVLGWLGNKPWTANERRFNAIFVHSMTLQFLLGLILYAFVSPITTQGVFPDFRAAMKDPQLRFWAVEHITAMVIALALAHIGSARVRKAASDLAKHKMAVIFFGLAMVLVFVSIPWASRPLFRF
ncbi:MAG: hypothetical protein EAZ92_10940 [Candidatus Kapaibacterium sp.]|nr:MAG: hypothetical protein EAZ92_10940 [Candidatus Kapabacteria bacterium]